MCARHGRGVIEICLSEKWALAKKRLGNTGLSWQFVWVYSTVFFLFPFWHLLKQVLLLQIVTFVYTVDICSEKNLVIYTFGFIYLDTLLNRHLMKQSSLNKRGVTAYKNIIIVVFIADSWSISQTQSYNTRAQNMVSHTVGHYKIGVCSWPTLREAKRINCTATSIIHQTERKSNISQMVHIGTQRRANCSEQSFKCLAMHLSWHW